MTLFDPKPGENITLDAVTYSFTPHPAMHEAAFGQEGRKAIVYQLCKNGSLFALKVFKQRFRDPALVDTCKNLSQLSLKGLEVCTRQCFTHANFGQLIQQHPDLEFAVFMPWILGSTWYDVLMAVKTISLDASKVIAKNTAGVLANLESRGYAHCDVAGANVIVNLNTGDVNFIDVEDMFGPGLPHPNAYPQGTDGYQHRVSRTLPQGQWCAAGDRFSAAVLLAEMLCWHNAEIRKSGDGEHYFAEDELQDPSSTRYQRMLDTLNHLSRQIGDCFSRAWASTQLESCPTLAEWAKLLEFPLVSEWTPIQAPPPAAPYKVTFDQLPAVKATPNFQIGFTPLTLPVPKLLEEPPFFRNTPENVLLWGMVAGAEGYIIEEADNTAFNNASEVYRGKINSFPAPKGFTGIRYYRVRAYNGNGQSNWSSGFASVRRV